jgi:amidase
VKSLADLIAFNKSDTTELRYFDQKILETAEAKGSLESPEYKAALATMLKGTREDGIDKLMNEFELDALMLPTGSPAWKTDLVDGDHYMGGNSSFAAIAGYPNITVPMGFIDELQSGIILRPSLSEPVLIEIAYGFEQGTKVRRAPNFF